MPLKTDFLFQVGHMSRPRKAATAQRHFWLRSAHGSAAVLLATLCAWLCAKHWSAAPEAPSPRSSDALQRFHRHLTAAASRGAELAKAWGPYVRHCLDCFGVDRCMFASNFPVDKVSCSYTALYNAFKRIVRDLPREDREKLFFRNAARVYRLAIDF